MKAYQVSNYEGYGEIVFAETPGQAKTHTRDLDDDFIDLSVRRAPEFDQYMGQTITPEILFKHGWWLTCQSCGRQVDGDSGTVVDGEPYCLDHFEDVEAKAE